MGHISKVGMPYGTAPDAEFVSDWKVGPSASDGAKTKWATSYFDLSGPVMDSTGFQKQSAPKPVPGPDPYRKVGLPFYTAADAEFRPDWKVGPRKSDGSKWKKTNLAQTSQGISPAARAMIGFVVGSAVTLTMHRFRRGT